MNSLFHYYGVVLRVRSYLYAHVIKRKENGFRGYRY